MAGVKGRSGGSRPGSGRPPKEQPPIALQEGGDPLEFLHRVWRGEVAPTDQQLKAAIEACRYVHKKPGGAGKKEAQREAADAVASGSRFGGRPQLKSVK